MSEFSISIRGSFSLRESARFITGWPPAEGIALASGSDLRLAFVRDGYRGHAGVWLRHENGTVRCELTGARDVAAVSKQTARILSLDHDAGDYPAVGERDPAIGRLQREHHGLRPVLFHSPYEAAAWSIISARVQPTRALATRGRLSRELGAVLDVRGQEMAAFPLPERLLELDPFPGLPDEKVRRLRGIADAALSGELDAEKLRSMPREEALTQLRTLRGIGPFYSTLILVRAAGARDELPAGEPRFREAVRDAYGLDEVPDEATVSALAEGWRPYRSWVAALIRVSASRPLVVSPSQ
jgi:DNA-3-methyladenine glycosylase II